MATPVTDHTTQMPHSSPSKNTTQATTPATTERYKNLSITEQQVNMLQADLQRQLIKTEEFYNAYLKDTSRLNNFKVGDLKTVLRFLKTLHRSSLTLAGRKDQMIEKIAHLLYKDTIGSDPMPFKTPAQANSYTSLFGFTKRQRTDEELKYIMQINRGDIAKHQDPYYKIEHYLDLVLVRRHGSFFSSTFDIPQDLLDRLNSDTNLVVHMQYYTLELKPQLWIVEHMVTVNDKPIELPKKVIKKSKKITDNSLYMALPATVPTSQLKNKNYIEYTIPKYLNPAEGVIIIQCVTKKSVQDLLKQVEEQTPTISGQNKQSHTLTEEIPTAADDDIIASDEVVSLKDNLTLTRIKTPAKGRNCHHKQCVDLQTYIEFSHPRLKWNCPICEKPLPLSDLFIDPFMKEVLGRMGPDTTYVVIHPDGTYEEQQNKNSGEQPQVKEDNAESESNGGIGGGSGNGSNKRAKAVVVDLDDLSDSEFDVPTTTTTTTTTTTATTTTTGNNSHYNNYYSPLPSLTLPASSSSSSTNKKRPYASITPSYNNNNNSSSSSYSFGAGSYNSGNNNNNNNNSDEVIEIE